MTRLLLTLGGVALVSLLGTPTLSGGWFWDAGNALGFVAFSGLLYLTVSTGPTLNLRAHQLLGYAVLGVVTAHIFWFLIGDPVATEYIKPGAPLYMWMGIGGFLLLVVLTIVALPQNLLRLHSRLASFRTWHRILAIASIAGAAWHIVGSGFYMRASYQIALFVALVALVCSGYRGPFRPETVSPRTAGLYLGLGALTAIAFVAIRNVV